MDLMIIMYPEVLLSLVVLSLVLYGINLSTFKVSIGVLLIIGIVIGFQSYYIVEDHIICWTNGLLMTNSWIIISKAIIVIGSTSLLLMGSSSEGEWNKISRDNERSSSILILIVALSSLLLVSSVNWLSIYLAIELQTLILFILAALRRDSAYSTEAGLKYFVLGAVSSGLFLFGCALLYGLTGETSIQGINSVLIADVGKILITISLLFKLSAAPFHMWAPDVYEGAPTTTTALLATIPKVGVFSILVQIGPVTNVVLVCGVLSIVYGAIGALNQTKIKRLLAYSGIGHMGFTLFGIAVGSFESVQASLIYIIIYIIMTICSFSIILSLKLTKDLIIEVSGLSRDNPVIALTLALTFLSIAGIPPLAGFLSKWLILLAGVSSGYYLICGVVVVSSVIAGVYYVRLVQIIYFPFGRADYSLLVWQKILRKEKRINLSKSLLIGFTFFIILFLMISPNFLLQITHDAAISLYM
uniref:NADH:ubiquinone reductase (H(+)-translocating) n=1 Tax=Polymastia littoralis TaxID=1473587 RepID=W8SVI1_POLLI|nr:NADH dehydrogenase subunit 2 [Polymastia littoralis]AHM12900.1 NADH dehydrogenase subunit 2 [Polymastia littoralis]